MLWEPIWNFLCQLLTCYWFLFQQLMNFYYLIKIHLNNNIFLGVLHVELLLWTLLWRSSLFTELICMNNKISFWVLFSELWKWFSFFFKGVQYPLIFRSVLMHHIQGIKLILPGASYPRGHPHCRLCASYPRALRWNTGSLSYISWDYLLRIPCFWSFTVS